MNNNILIRDLIKLIGFNKPCLYLAARGEVVLYCLGTRLNKTGIQYELLAIVNEDTNSVLTAWYDAEDMLPDFNLLDYVYE